MMNRVAVLLMVSCLAVAVVQAEYEFAIACEDWVATLSCADDKKIRVEDAMYGRTQEHACDDGRDHLDCVAATSRPVVEGICGIATNSQCTVLASNNIFGDPCPGGSKYLQIIYECV